MVVGNVVSDEIVLKNGHTLRGHIIAERDDKFQIETLYGILTVQKSQIESLRRHSPEKNEIIKAEILLSNAEWGKSFLTYLNVLNDESTSPGEVARSIVNHKDRLLRAIPELTQGEKIRLALIIEKLLPCVRQDDEFCFFTGQVYFALNERNKAFKIFTTLPADFFDKHTEEKKFVQVFFQRYIEELLDKREFTKALESVETIHTVDSAVGKSFEIILYLHWGLNLRSNGDYEGALKIYTEKLYPLSPAIARNRIELTFNELISNARKQHNYKETIALVEKYAPQFLPETYENTLSELLLSYGNWLLSEGKYDEASHIFERYYQYQSPMVEKTLLYVCEYKKRASQLAEKDYAGHYELGKFCLNKNLPDKAIEEFQKSAESPEFKENAMMQIRLIKERREIELFNQAMKFYEMAQYVKALDVLQELQKEFPDGKLSSDADKLVRLCQDGLKDEMWRRPYQAEVYYQQAERLYFIGDYNSALDKINTILSLYPDTPAGEKARNLQRRIAQMIHLASLEGLNLNIDTSRIPPSVSAPEDKKQLEKEIKSLISELDKF